MVILSFVYVSRERDGDNSIFLNFTQSPVNIEELTMRTKFVDKIIVKLNNDTSFTFCVSTEILHRFTTVNYVDYVHKIHHTLQTSQKPIYALSIV